jgi:hypothetical protein
VSSDTDTDGPATTERWEPDDQLVPAALAGGKAMADLALPDRCWAVAGLTRAGITAPDIADRLGCSLRLVRSVRAEPMTQLCLRYMEETSAFTDELRLARSEQTRLAGELATTTREHVRIKGQLANLLDAHMLGAVGTCKRGHPFTDYNTYVCPQSGKRSCRTCRRETQADLRASRATT